MSAYAYVGGRKIIHFLLCFYPTPPLPSLFSLQFRGLTFGYEKTNGSTVLKSCLEYAMNRHSNFLPGEAGFLLKFLQEVCTHLLCTCIYHYYFAHRYTANQKLCYTAGSSTKLTSTGIMKRGIFQYNFDLIKTMDAGYFCWMHSNNA